MSNIFQAILTALESTVRSFSASDTKKSTKLIKICELLAIIFIQALSEAKFLKFSEIDVAQILNYFKSCRVYFRTKFGDAVMTPAMTQVISMCVNEFTIRNIQPNVIPRMPKIWIKSGSCQSENGKNQNSPLKPIQPSKFHSISPKKQITFTQLPLTTGYHFNLYDLYSCYKSQQINETQFIEIAKYILQYYKSGIFEIHRKSNGAGINKFCPEKVTGSNLKHKLHLQIHRQKIDETRYYKMNMRSCFAIMYMVLSGKYQPFYYYNKKQGNPLKLAEPAVNKVKPVIVPIQAKYENFQNSQTNNSEVQSSESGKNSQAKQDPSNNPKYLDKASTREAWMDDFENLTLSLASLQKKAVSRAQQMMLIQTSMKILRQFHTHLQNGIIYMDFMDGAKMKNVVLHNVEKNPTKNWKIKGPFHDECFEICQGVVHSFVELLLVLMTEYDYRHKYFKEYLSKILKICFSIWKHLKSKHRLNYYKMIPLVKRETIEVQFMKMQKRC